MPRGKKSKARAREKRRLVQEEAQGLKDDEAKAAEKGESASCSDHDSRVAVASTSTTGFPQDKAPTTTAGKGMAHKRSGKGAKGQEEKNGSSCRSLLSSGSKRLDLLSKKTGLLVEYMLCKYKIKQPARREEMLKVINKRFKNQFPDIFKRASHRLDMVFGIELKEIQPNSQSYILVSKLDFQDDGSESNEMGVPNKGILIPLLSVIYLNGYRAPEEEVWKFLNMLGVYDGVPHLIFGNVRKLITVDLVQEMYLEYCQVPYSDPPSYEFLWGPGAYDERCQVKVMEFLAHVNETGSSTYPFNHEESLKEKDKAQAEGAAQRSTKSKAKRRSKAKSSLPTPAVEV